MSRVPWQRGRGGRHGPAGRLPQAMVYRSCSGRRPMSWP
jgi:hypothetical protein